jgi:thiamine-phosphate pyrophosphorylase
MTDERQGEALWTALDRLPRGAGVVFRHYSLPCAERRALFRRVHNMCARRRLMLVLAGDPVFARAMGSARLAWTWDAEGRPAQDGSCP